MTRTEMSSFFERSAQGAIVHCMWPDGFVKWLPWNEVPKDVPGLRVFYDFADLLLAVYEFAVAEQAVKKSYRGHLCCDGSGCDRMPLPKSLWCAQHQPRKVDYASRL